MAGFLDTGDKVASIVGALIGSAALAVSIIALQRNTRAGVRRDRRPAAPPRPGLGPEVAGPDPGSSAVSDVQVRGQAARSRIALALMAGTILLFALAVQTHGAVPLVLTCLLIWTSAALAISATTQMFIVTRERPGRRLIPGIGSAIFVVITALPFVDSWIALLTLTGFIDE